MNFELKLSVRVMQTLPVKEIRHINSLQLKQQIKKYVLEKVKSLNSVSQTKTL